MHPFVRFRSLLRIAMTFALLFAGGAVAVRGQSALDGFDPNANGEVDSIVVQADGRILIGGGFTTLSPNGGGTVTRNHIARLNPDGTLDTAFDPNADSDVFAIAVQADGKILVGGTFNNIGGQPRNRIARLDATAGAADLTFDPNANGTVFSIAVQADGKILVGGAFNQSIGTPTIGGQTRNRIARLDATTGAADLTFDPNANGTVRVVVVQPDGKILVGGAFNGATSIGGQTRNRIARLDATTGAADTFDPNANNFVLAIAIQADGQILAGGLFFGATSIGGQTRNRIARLDATTGAADLTFDPNATSIVNAIALQPDGKILAGGQFGGIGGQTRVGIARLDPTTGLADSFDPNPDNFVFSIAVQPDGKILAGGQFSTLSPNGGGPVTRNQIARLETDGRLDQTLDLSIVGLRVFATAVQPDGKILIGGTFTTVLGVARNNIARLNADGTLDMAFDPNANNIVDSIAVQADGKILVGGFFNGANSIGGQMRNRIARLDATTGAADVTFNPNASDVVRAIAVQADGKILVGGDFNGANSVAGLSGATRNYIARLDATTGAADLTFDPNANLFVLSIAVQADGKILVGGAFNGTNSIGGQTRNHIARLDPTTGLADLTFDPNANDIVYSITVQPDGKILAGGAFNGTNSIGGQTRNRIARLSATTGAADLTFDPNANDLVLSIAVQADGKILAGGDFFGANSIGGQMRNGIARLDATTGAADLAFDPNADNFVNSIALQADGKILAGGEFTSIGGQTRNRFARLSNDTAALQNLAVTQTTVTWTRGGSSPQFTRVTFEFSTDNVTYNPLGNGTASGNNWTLTGLNVATGQNVYIRARGYYRSGYQNASESITESVRNAFLQGTTAADGNVSGQITDSNGASISGVTITLSGTESRKTITDASGHYSFDNVETNGFYTITPSRVNYSFSPQNRSFSLLGLHTDASFTASANSGSNLNPLDSTDYFVRQQYLDFLGREPDQSGFAFWSNEINSCGSDQGCIERERINVSAAFFLSIEFQQTGYEIYRMYKAAYGNLPGAPVPVRFGELMADTPSLSQGVVVNQPGWQQTLEINTQAFAREFVQRGRFTSSYPTTMTPAEFVDKLFANAGVTPSGSERTAAISEFGSASETPDAAARGRALRQIAENSTFTQQESNQAFVLMQYFGYLRRDPNSGPDTDFSGYNFWLNKLNTFGGNFQDAEMVKAFLVSGEYRGRFPR